MSKIMLHCPFEISSRSEKISKSEERNHKAGDDAHSFQQMEVTELIPKNTPGSSDTSLYYLF